VRSLSWPHGQHACGDGHCLTAPLPSRSDLVDATQPGVTTFVKKLQCHGGVRLGARFDERLAIDGTGRAGQQGLVGPARTDTAAPPKGLACSRILG